MNIDKRLRMIQIAEKIRENKVYAKKIGIQDVSKFDFAKKKDASTVKR